MLATLSVFFFAAASSLPLSTPAAQQMSAAKIQQFFESLNSQSASEIHHVIVARNGYIVAQLHPAPFAPEQTHTQYSISKTVTALAVGLAVDQGLLDIDIPIAGYLPDSIVAKGKNHFSEITLRHLMSMTSGLANGVTVRSNSDDWLFGYLTHTFDHVPGSFYYYDTMSAYAVAAILERITGRSMLDLLQQYLFDAMDIHDVEWERCPKGVCTGGWGLRTSAESLTKIGQLMLNNGLWDNQQLISSAWLEQMTTPQSYDPYLNSTSEYGNGYGLFTYRCTRDGAFRAEGNQGQLLVMVPDCQLVVMIQGSSKDAVAPSMRAIWNYLVSACDNADNNSEQSQQALLQYAAQCALPVAEGQAWNYPTDSLRLKIRSNTYGVKRLAIVPNDTAAALYLQSSTEIDTLLAGYGTWLESQLHNTKPYYSISARNRFSGISTPYTAAASYSWNGDTLNIVILYNNWGSGLSLQFNTKTKRVTIKANYESSPVAEVLFTIENENERYDIDGNGTVEISDLNILISYLLDPYNEVYSRYNTDLNNDKSTDVADVNILITKILNSF